MDNYGGPLEPWEIEMIRIERRKRVEEKLGKLAPPEEEEKITIGDVLIAVAFSVVFVLVVFGWVVS